MAWMLTKNEAFTSLYGFPQVDTLVDFLVKADLIATLGRRLYYEINTYIERINQNYSINYLIRQIEGEGLFLSSLQR